MSFLTVYNKKKYSGKIYIAVGIGAARSVAGFFREKSGNEGESWNCAKPGGNLLTNRPYK